MLFHSIEFFIFFIVVFVLNWTIARLNLCVLRNGFILGASYLFYGWWDWRFLILIVFSSLTDYVIGLCIHKSPDRRNRLLLLWLSISINLSLLGTFKYFHFFVDNFIIAFEKFGVSLHPVSINIILPVGISFYTFQSLSYTIDIYRKKLKPTQDTLAFLAFVSFFPQLVAGPIERAQNLLPQFYRIQPFDYDKGRDALRQILWGLFKKLVIADGLAPSVDWIFGNFEDQNGSTLVIGAVFFAFQIYCDFSGYSDMAIGFARLLGFELTQNFAFPYFSRNIAEFWRRWHISLSTWFRDYVFIPLGGSYPNKSQHDQTQSSMVRFFLDGWTSLKQCRNIILTFIVSGLWHGANWTFIIWGCFHGLLYVPLLFYGTHKMMRQTGKKWIPIPTLTEIAQILITFSLVTVGWIFFRSLTIGEAFQYIQMILSQPWLTDGIPSLSRNRVIASPFATNIRCILFLLIVEWFHRRQLHGLALSAKVPVIMRWCLYSIIIYLIILFADTTEPFIYFQF